VCACVMCVCVWCEWVITNPRAGKHLRCCGSLQRVLGLALYVYVVCVWCMWSTWCVRMCVHVHECVCLSLWVN